MSFVVPSARASWSNRPRSQYSVPNEITGVTFSRDGRWITYRKTGTDGVRPDSGISYPGLYVVAADPGGGFAEGGGH